ncbi:Ig-like domain-containing protein [Polaribacter marinaquae]|uniref:Ig-like domain-containing protein n=1 Tax=Polaribacter marinaquae TaxID=1642819 RepID=A0ABZ2TUB2_9FLAO
MKNIFKYSFYILFVVLFSCNSNDDDFTETAVSSIIIDGDHINDGTSSQMRAEIFPITALNKSIIWSVSNETIATISSSGLVKAITNGSLTVFATSKDNPEVSSSKDILVSGVVVPDVLVSSLTIYGSDIINGQPQNFTVEVFPANATNQDVSWSVSDNTIATINSEGLLTPINNGVVKVIATSKDPNAVSAELEISISGFSNIQGVSTSTELLNAIQNAISGDVIYVKEGVFTFSTTIKITQSGTSTNQISIITHPNNSQRPIFDFSLMSENSSNRGIELSGNYWHIKGIKITKAGDNGVWINGNNNLVEYCEFSENSDTGLQISSGGSNNTILNCDSFFNADSTLENADGFASKLDAGDGNKFIGCRAWQNLDDGWDGYLKGTDNITTTYENCWAIKNGYLKDGSKGVGDGNGFKTGGSDDKTLKHNAIFKNCLAVGNVVDGFDHNSNRGNVEIYNSGAYNNSRNINFGSSNIANALTIKNTVSFSGDNNDSYNATNIDISNNGWQNGILTNTSDYVSLDIDLLTSARQLDGSLPELDFMKLVDGSDLVNAGINVGLSFNGSAPDIGPFEK